MTTLVGTGRLMALVLRRDRVQLSLWAAGIVGLVIAQAIGVLEIYPDQAAVERYVALFGGNAALIAFAGPGYGFDDPNIGVVLVNEIQVFGCLATALMSIFLVNRHTRAEEDSERADLVRSTVVGRHAPTAAAMAVVAAANVLIGVLCTLSLIALDFPAAGSLALAGSLTAVGLVFAGVTAVMAQIGSSGRATIGGSCAVLGAAFVVRAAGDISGNGLSWLSPIGWGQAVRAYAGERWWTLGVCLAAAVLLGVAAFWLSTRRDLGSGLRAQRPGSPVAARSLTTSLGLAWRLQRGALAGWVTGLFLIGVVFGSLGEDVEQFLEDNPAMADVFARLGDVDPTDSFIATSLVMIAVIAGGFTVSSVLYLRAEESAGRVESVLATRLSRGRWAGGHLLIAAGGTVLTIAVGGVGFGIAYAVVTGDAAEIPRVLGAALVTVPGILVLLGIATLVFGFAPRLAPIAWAALAVMVVVGFFSELLRLPAWVTNLSPLEHLPAAPAEAVTALPLVVLTVLAAALVAAGLAGLRRRDLQLH